MRQKAARIAPRGFFARDGDGTAAIAKSGGFRDISCRHRQSRVQDGLSVGIGKLMEEAGPVDVSRVIFAAEPLSFPAATSGRRINRRYAFTVGSHHLLALLAFAPWFFSWTGVALAVIGVYVFGAAGINLCYHRLLSHRSFSCPLWLEHGFAIIATCCVEDTPARWVGKTNVEATEEKLK